MYVQPFVCDTIQNTVYENLAVFVSGEYIYPFNYCEGDKISSVFLGEFVSAAH